MKIMKKFLIPFAIVTTLLLSGACSTTGKKTTAKLKKYVQQRKYDDGLKLVRSDKFYPEKRSRLLKLLEEGMLHHLAGNYYQSVTTFDKAKDLSDRLFTVSISKKVASALVNSNADNYYGEKYERSLIRFYLSLNHFMIYQTGIYEAHTVRDKNSKKGERQISEVKLSRSKRQIHLSSARATILEWDSLLENYKSVTGGTRIYKVDLTAKLFGAFIHEQIGTRADLQIAKQLYRDAKKVLYRNYNVYPVFNKKSDKFRSDYSKLHKMPKHVVDKKYVKKTFYAKNLLKFIEKRLKQLKKRKGNVAIVIQSGLIAGKKARVIEFPISLPGGGSVRGPGGGLLGFARNLLLLSNTGKPCIKFELPEVSKKKTSYKMAIIAKSSSGKEIKTPLVIINPLSDMANEALDRKIASTYLKIGARIGAKYVAAVVAAYSTYKIASKKSPGFIAHAGAVLAYKASAAGIEASEKADVRHWSTLPHNLRLAYLNLPNGEYEFSLKRANSKGKISIIPLGRHTINGKSGQLLNFKVD